jgi:hypothetical protein
MPPIEGPRGVDVQPFKQGQEVTSHDLNRAYEAGLRGWAVAAWLADRVRRLEQHEAESARFFALGRPNLNRLGRP